MRFPSRVILLFVSASSMALANEPAQPDRIDQLLQCAAYAMFDPDKPSLGEKYINEARRLGGKALEKDLMERLAAANQAATADSYERYKQGISNNRRFAERAVACRALVSGAAAPVEGR